MDGQIGASVGTAEPPAIAVRLVEQFCKMDEGMSIDVPVCGMLYVIQRTDCAKAIELESTSVKAIRPVAILISRVPYARGSI